MSLFFLGERKPKVVVPDLVPDLDAALKAVSRREIAERVAGAGSIQVGVAHQLIAKCRAVEPLLLRAIQDGSVKTQAEAVQFLRDQTDGFFPAVRFVACLKEAVGSDLAPATWAQVVDAAKSEDVG